MEPRFDGLLGFPNDFSNKSALNLNKFRGHEKVLKANSLPSRPIDQKTRRNAMSQQNLPSFITSKGIDNPFSVECNSLLLDGEQAKATRVLRETIKIPGESMKTMARSIRSPKKVFEDML